MTDYMTRWDEAQPIKDCSIDIIAQFIFECKLTRFGYPKILMSDRGSHFLNNIIEALTEEFQVCNINQNDWDVHIRTMLWAYRTTCKKLRGHTPFRLVYGQEVVMSMEYIVPSLRITTVTNMADNDIMEEILDKLLVLEEDRFLAGFHQQVQKAQEKAWHD
eukprot:PITA_07316